jgi:ATP-binding cassette subfamily F protein 3
MDATSAANAKSATGATSNALPRESNTEPAESTESRTPLKRVASGSSAPAKPAVGPRLVRPDGSRHAPVAPADTSAAPAAVSYEEKKRLESEARKTRKALEARRKRIDDLETRIAEREQAIRDIEVTMAAPGFYDNHEEAKPIIDKHQALMWEVGDLMHQWEELQQTDL